MTSGRLANSLSHSSQTPPSLGPYALVRELGRGGMGVVYEARHPTLGSRVALKVMLDPELGGDGEARFLSEARTCAVLVHPNVARVLDAGRDRGHPYLVMDFVEGESLADRLKRAGRLPQAEAARIGAVLARTLEFVHGQGVVHRDLKPANVLLAGERPVLTDFGLARDPQRERERLTRTGQMLGTPEYMAPEQADGYAHQVDGRADLYALGATLYALLSGAPPFRGKAVLEVLRQVLEEPPRPCRELCPELDPALEAIVLRCLAKDPGERWPSAAALAAALEAWSAARSPRSPALDDPDPDLVPSAGRGLPPLALGAAALGIAALGVAALGAAALLVRQRPPAEGPASSPAARSPTPPATPSAAAFAPAPSPPPSAPALAERLAAARALLDARRFAEARAAVEPLVRAAPREAGLHAFLAGADLQRWYYRCDVDLAVARGESARAVELDPSSGELLALDCLIRILREESGWEPDAARALHLDPRSALVWVCEGRRLSYALGPRRGEQVLPAEVQAIREASARIEDLAEGRRIPLGEAGALLTGLADRGLAPDQDSIDAHERAARLLARDPLFPTRIGFLWKNRAERAMHEGDLPRALRLLERATQLYDLALQLDPDYWNAYMERGYAWLLRGSYTRDPSALAKADQDLVRSCAIATRHYHPPWVLFVVRRARQDQQGQLEALDEVIRRKPDHLDALCERAVRRAALKEREAALADAQEALRLMPPTHRSRPHIQQLVDVLRR
ncbi:MAG: protein kinase [Planctomycetota bacterium]